MKTNALRMSRDERKRFLLLRAARGPRACQLLVRVSLLNAH